MIESPVETSSERWRKAVVGQLSNDFLRVYVPSDVHNASEYPYQMNAQQQLPSQYMISSHIGRLSITCAQAKLSRNYGITKMDPYVRIRVGHYVYETQTSQNGGKNPRWNRVVHSQLAAGVKSIHIEIYDECSFKMDELIAWCEIPIPESVMQGETHEEWYALSGKQGEGQEGTIDIVLNYSVQPYTYPLAPSAHLIMGHPARPIFLAPMTQLSSQAVNQPAVPTPAYTEEDFRQVCDIFPNIDKEVIKTVFDSNRGNKSATINNLLQLND